MDAERRRATRWAGSPTRAVRVLVAVLVVAGAGCTSEPPAEISTDEYRSRLAEVCNTAAAQRDALVEPIDATDVATFAIAVAGAIDDEAEAARALQAPSELDDDHRAFVQNTFDQANRWTTLAATPPDDVATFGALQTELLQLTLGRDDLAVEMGVHACRRSAP